MKNIERIAIHISSSAKAKIERDFARQTQAIYFDLASDDFFDTKGEISALVKNIRNGNHSSIINFLETTEESKQIHENTEYIKDNLEKFVSDSHIEILTCVMNKWREEMEKLCQEYSDHIKGKALDSEGKNLKLTISYSKRYGLDHLSPCILEYYKNERIKWYEDNDYMFSLFPLKIKEIYGFDTSSEVIYITSRWNKKRP